MGNLVGSALTQSVVTELKTKQGCFYDLRALVLEDVNTNGPCKKDHLCAWMPDVKIPRLAMQPTCDRLSVVGQAMSSTISAASGGVTGLTSCRYKTLGDGVTNGHLFVTSSIAHNFMCTDQRVFPQKCLKVPKSACHTMLPRCA